TINLTNGNFNCRQPEKVIDAGQAGSPEMTGGVLSILMVTGTDIDNPAPFVAEHVRVVPGVSAVSVVAVQPDEDAMPDSGSLTLQLTVTLLLYQPFAPNVPAKCGVINGGVVSVAAIA